MEGCYIVDRIGDKFYFLENDKCEIIEVEKKLVYGNIKEGHVLIKKDGIYILDEEKTKERKSRIDTLMEDMWVE